MRQIYLDSNILIAHYSTDEAEDTKKKMVENALAVFAELKDIQLCTYLFTSLKPHKLSLLKIPLDICRSSGYRKVDESMSTSARQ